MILLFFDIAVTLGSFHGCIVISRSRQFGLFLCLFEEVSADRLGEGHGIGFELLRGEMEFSFALGVVALTGFEKGSGGQIVVLVEVFASPKVELFLGVFIEELAPQTIEIVHYYFIYEVVVITKIKKNINGLFKYGMMEDVNDSITV